MSRATILSVSILVTLMATSAGLSYGDSISGGFLRYYYDVVNDWGELNLSDGNTWVITFWDLDFNSFTGNFEVVYGDRGDGSSWKKFYISIAAHAAGAGGHLLEAWDYEKTTLKSTHALAAGEGSNPIDLRAIVSQNLDGTWHIVPMFRLTGGEWTIFSGGAYDSDIAFNLTKSFLMLQFAGGTGTVFFTPPTAGTGNFIAEPDPLSFTSGSPVQTVNIDYVGGMDGLLYAYSVSFSWDGTVASTDSSKVTQGTLLSDQGGTWFEAHGTGTDTITVDCTLLGAQLGVSGPGTLFSIEFTGLACDSSILDITIDQVVDKDNSPLGGYSENDGELHVDLADPIFTVNGPFPDSVCYNFDPVLDLAVNDPCSDLDSAFYRIDGGAWQTDVGLFADHAGGSWANAAWTLPGYAGLAEGIHTVELRAIDDFGNVSNLPAWVFIKDTVDPSAATSFAATTGNGQIHLTWGNPGSDFDHVQIYRKTWDGTPPYGYPEYVQPAVGYSTGPGDGDLIYSGPAIAYDDTLPDRSIYFYHAVVYDCAGNFTAGTPPVGGLPDAFAQGDRSTNYWLGDVTQSGGGGYDGQVDFFDLNALSAGYRKYNPGNPPVPPHDELDVGPTDDGNRLGVPIPDDDIEFQDLVIFAMNFNVVTPTGKDAPVVRLDSPVEAGKPVLHLDAPGGAAEVGEMFIVTLSLRSHDSEVKAASVFLEHDADRLEWVETRMSSGLAKSGLVFFQSGTKERGEVWVDLAALGTDKVIHGSGELAQIVFRVKESGDLSLRFAETDLRDAEGGRIGAATSDLAMGSTGSIPAVTRLVGVQPNPFNPTTRVKFELNRRQDVQIHVYDVQGRLVRALLQEARNAGSHTVVWDGKDDSNHAVGSGSYFVRMQTVSYEKTTKVVMVR